MNAYLLNSWSSKKEKLKLRFPDLKDKDLSYLLGKENSMMENLGFKLGKTRLEILDIIIGL
jgi:hypothetical protein